MQVSRQSTHFVQIFTESVNVSGLRRHNAAGTELRGCCFISSSRTQLAIASTKASKRKTVVRQAGHDTASQRQMLHVHPLLRFFERSSRLSSQVSAHVMIDNRRHHRNQSTFLFRIFRILLQATLETIFFLPLGSVRLRLQLHIAGKRNWFKLQASRAHTAGHQAFNSQQSLLLPGPQQFLCFSCFG